MASAKVIPNHVTEKNSTDQKDEMGMQLEKSKHQIMFALPLVLYIKIQEVSFLPQTSLLPHPWPFHSPNKSPPLPAPPADLWVDPVVAAPQIPALALSLFRSAIVGPF